MSFMLNILILQFEIKCIKPHYIGIYPPILVEGDINGLSNRKKHKKNNFGLALKNKKLDSLFKV